MTSATYQVTGMTCEHCVRAVTDELKNLRGISDVTVALSPGGQSAVTVISGAPLTVQAVAAALDEAGGYQLAAAVRLAAEQEGRCADEHGDGREPGRVRA